MSKPIYEIPVTDTIGGRAAAPPSGLLPPPSPLPPVADVGASAPPRAAPSRSRRDPDSSPQEQAPLAGDWRSAPPPAATFAPAQDSPEQAAPSSPVMNEALQPDPALMFALQEVLLHTASDLHVASNAIPMLRVDGALRPLSTGELWPAERVRAALMTLLRPSQREQFDRRSRTRLRVTASRPTRGSASTTTTNAVTSVRAFRLIPTEIKQLAELGCPDTVARFATLPRGLVLVTGPTGSGKSTTLAAIIDLVNRNRADHIVTIEDPIEYMHINKKSLINQREVGNDTHSFATALKHVLRQDPDVILVGELRDLETISVALTAARDRSSRLCDASYAGCTANHRSHHRRVSAAPAGASARAARIHSPGGRLPDARQACERRGPVVATEILVTTPAIGKPHSRGQDLPDPAVMQAGREAGMYTMDQHLADLANSGQITNQSALDKAHDLESLKRLINGTENVSRAPDMKSGIDFGDAYSVQGARR